MFIRWRQLLRRGRGQEGAAAVEFALCLIPLLLIVAGIVDFGESWYMQSVLASASREGAGYNLTSLLPSNAVPAVIPGGAGYTTGTAGQVVSVQVTAKKYWLFLNNLIPGLTNPQTLSSTTTMACE